jgi:NADH:ubiquinone oxidoreductase subunit 6 (subunit J)
LRRAKFKKIQRKIKLGKLNYKGKSMSAPIKDQAIKHFFTYVSLCLAIIFFIYAVITLIIGPNITKVWYATIFRGFFGIFFGVIFLKKTKGDSDKKIRLFRSIIWLSISFIILCFLFIVFIYLVI